MSNDPPHDGVQLHRRVHVVPNSGDRTDDHHPGFQIHHFAAMVIKLAGGKFSGAEQQA
jgi:hypothetical protein